MQKSIELRKEYKLKSLDIKDLSLNPFLQFSHWFQDALAAKVLEPNAMFLATVSSDGRPSCRTVLLRNFQSEAFTFFTNYESRKGKDLAHTPWCSVTFYWGELERQIIIDGKAEKLSQEKSEIYFSTRPRGSQLGAWASHQDERIESREMLEKNYEYFEKLYEGKNVPMPPYWGGYLIHPTRFEFWQGRENRLHDRFCYALIEKTWHIHRLAP